MTPNKNENMIQTPSEFSLRPQLPDMQGDYQSKIKKYLEYLSENMKLNQAFLDYIVSKVDEVEFDKPNGVKLEKACNGLGRSIESMMNNSETVASELEKLFGTNIKRDTRINKILDK